MTGLVIVEKKAKYLPVSDMPKVVLVDSAYKKERSRMKITYRKKNKLRRCYNCLHCKVVRKTWTDDKTASKSNAKVKCDKKMWMDRYGFKKIYSLAFLMQDYIAIVRVCKTCEHFESMEDEE